MLATAAHAHLSQGGGYLARRSQGGARPRVAHGSPGGARLHTSRAAPAQLAVARAKLAGVARDGRDGTRPCTASLPRASPHAQLVPPTQCGDPQRPSPPD
jgi:hypothetical protein